jgi:D-3-phosphoglycerate dehydrogenase
VITVFIGTKMTGKTVSRVFLVTLFSKIRNILMDIKILHIDSNNPILMRQLQELGFENHEDFTSSKEQIEAK